MSRGVSLCGVCVSWKRRRDRVNLFLSAHCAHCCPQLLSAAVTPVALGLSPFPVFANWSSAVRRSRPFRLQVPSVASIRLVPCVAPALAVRSSSLSPSCASTCPSAPCAPVSDRPLNVPAGSWPPLSAPPFPCGSTCGERWPWHNCCGHPSTRPCFLGLLWKPDSLWARGLPCTVGLSLAPHLCVALVSPGVGGLVLRVSAVCFRVHFRCACRFRTAGHPVRTLPLVGVQCLRFRPTALQPPHGDLGQCASLPRATARPQARLSAFIFHCARHTLVEKLIWDHPPCEHRKLSPPPAHSCCLSRSPLHSWVLMPVF